MSAKTEPASIRTAVLQRILGGYLTSRSKLDLLIFWGRYPGGWFGRKAVSPLTRASRRQIEEALDELVQEGVIECRRDGAMSLYALTGDPTIRSAVEELPRLTRTEHRDLLHHSLRQHGVSDDQQGSHQAAKVLKETIEGSWS
jgi:DNA-binding transcriptional ArsR family regulator